MKRFVLLFMLVLPVLALAQQSAGYKLEEHALNAGGHPHGGAALASTSYRLSFGAIGPGVSPAALAGASYQVSGGLVGFNPPPGEVMNVRFTDSTTLVWDAERSVGSYNLYLGSLSNPFDPNYGSCDTTGIAAETTTVTSTPSDGEALFLLVTAENRLKEEGTKGPDSAGARRDNTNSCP